MSLTLARREYLDLLVVGIDQGLSGDAIRSSRQDLLFLSIGRFDPWRERKPPCDRLTRWCPIQFEAKVGIQGRTTAVPGSFEIQFLAITNQCFTPFGNRKQGTGFFRLNWYSCNLETFETG